MADPELVAQYRRILAAGFANAEGDPVNDELHAAGEQAVTDSAAILADQLERSILDAPWLRQDALNVVEDWITSGDTLDLADLTSALEPMFGASRALMIARTETANAFNSANLAGLQSHGWGQVVWVAADDACPDCADMDGTVLSIGEAEADPTLHPNCSCTFEPFDGDMSDGTDEDVSDGEEG